MRSINRKLLCLVAGFAFAYASLFGTQQTCTAEPAKLGSLLVYIGTYTGEKSEGIYVSRLDPKTGSMSKPELAAQMVSPSWVTVHPSGKFLYAAGESESYKEGGVVASFSIGQDGKLTSLNSRAPNGRGPCHLAIDQSGKTILVSNYGSGNVSSLQIAKDGTLSPSQWQDQYPTLGDKHKPHAHHAGFDPTNRFAFVCDAGLDRICVYRFNAVTGVLTANDPPFAKTIADTHPRHLTFSHDGKFCYDIDEKAMSVTAFRFDAKLGVLSQIQAISTLPRDFDGKAGSTAELIMHPSGKYLYGSNRGPDNIVGYSVNAQTGKLALVGHTSTRGKTARSFGIDPTGRWMIVGNQESNTVVQFAINLNTGALTATGIEFEIGSPVCFQFLAVKP